MGSAYGAYMGPIWDLCGTYVGPIKVLSHPRKSDELKMGPIRALNDIPVIKVGTIWVGHM